MDWPAELKRCVQALAQPAAVQRTLYPSFVIVGDELVLELDDALRGWRSEKHGATPQQFDALMKLDAYIESLSGPPNEDFWLDPLELERDPRWDEIRSLASGALAAFGWAAEVPAASRAAYVVASDWPR